MKIADIHKSMKLSILFQRTSVIYSKVTKISSLNIVDFEVFHFRSLNIS